MQAILIIEGYTNKRNMRCPPLLHIMSQNCLFWLKVYLSHFSSPSLEIRAFFRYVQSINGFKLHPSYVAMNKTSPRRRMRWTNGSLYNKIPLRFIVTPCQVGRNIVRVGISFNKRMEFKQNFTLKIFCFKCCFDK